jgi:hypothetical protein
MEFSVKQDAYNKQVYKLVKELQKRVDAIMGAVPLRVAEEILEDVKRGAPKDIPGYPKMLHLARVDMRGLESVIMITVPGYAYSFRLRMADVPTTVLYVKPREFKSRELDPGAVILAKYNPWTMGTLPYEPNRMEASITSRQVSPREVQTVEKQRQADRPKVDEELKKAGKKVGRPHATLLQRRVSRDIAYEVLRREFGINTKGVAHWRPAVRAARSRYVPMVLRKLVRWLTVPSERRWKRRVTLPKEKTSTVRKVQAFQGYIARGR